jgi:pimeloyl-ACP methyl ester carboxylesterase
VLRKLSAEGGTVLIGGHSAGGGVVEELAEDNPTLVKGAIFLNGFTHGDLPVPSLVFMGSKDYVGDVYGANSVGVVLEGVDHSGRYAPDHYLSSREKDEANRTVDTWEIARLMAKRIKSWTEGLQAKQ